MQEPHSGRLRKESEGATREGVQVGTAGAVGQEESPGTPYGPPMWPSPVRRTEFSITGELHLVSHPQLIG